MSSFTVDKFGWFSGASNPIASDFVGGASGGSKPGFLLFLDRVPLGCLSAGVSCFVSMCFCRLVAVLYFLSQWGH